MLHQDNGKYFSTKETIVVAQDCPKFLGSPVTYGSQMVKVLDRFEIKTMKDYHNLYLKFDVLLLVDVFEKIRNSSFRNFGLCQNHYLSAPPLSWDAMLNPNLGGLFRSSF